MHENACVYRCIQVALVLNNTSKSITKNITFISIANNIKLSESLYYIHRIIFRNIVILINNNFLRMNYNTIYYIYEYYMH